VRHYASSQFWFCYRNLPGALRGLADKNLALLKNDPRRPSLRLKRVGKYYSVRVGLSHRALGVDVPTGILWF
jgi:hypothetical protein